MISMNINVTNDSLINVLQNAYDETTASKEPHETSSQNTKSGSTIRLRNKYVLWRHDVYTKKWDINSYTKLCTISTVADFWKMFYTIIKLDTKFVHYFLMKENVEPTWEDPKNRNGGICSFRIEYIRSMEMWEQICSMMACDVLIDDMDDITGTSYSPKNNWTIIKIWNSDCNNDISTSLSSDIKKDYPNISIKYRMNKPEY